MKFLLLLKLCDNNKQKELTIINILRIQVRCKKIVHYIKNYDYYDEEHLLSSIKHSTWIWFY
jgi:hypothetical protein